MIIAYFGQRWSNEWFYFFLFRWIDGSIELLFSSLRKTASSKKDFCAAIPSSFLPFLLLLSSSSFSFCIIIRKLVGQGKKKRNCWLLSFSSFSSFFFLSFSLLSSSHFSLTVQADEGRERERETEREWKRENSSKILWGWEHWTKFLFCFRPSFRPSICLVERASFLACLLAC